ncbi:MAG: hypothetical protein EBS92_06460, partial [Proteobacteria bacterium]|nr:hypothetical protein [Pseudomonadota bacterium]
MPEIKKTSYNSEYIEDKEEQIEYCNLVKESVDSGKYFKDALDWYHLRYITPICDRAYLILTILLLFFMIYVVKTMSDSIFPLVVQQPIFTSAKNAYADKDRFSPRIVKLKPRQGEAGFDPRIENFDDSVIKYLLINYVQDREQFDFRKAKIEDVNKKFNVSDALYQSVMEVMKSDKKEGSIPRNDKEKELAAAYGDPKRITHGDVLKMRGVTKEEA